MNFNEIKTRNDLSLFLDIPIKKLTYVLYAKKPDSFYHSFEINKKNGGTRTINAPTGDLKELQIKLARSLYKHRKFVNEQNNIVTSISQGFEKNKNIITNAKNHVNKKFIINMDLENFFASFHFGRVRGYFQKNKYINLPVEIATIIAQLVCHKGELPQGAPTSPVITNMICEILDNRLLYLAKDYKLYYTRYADDLTFSTNDRMILERYDSFLKGVESEILNFGLSVNHKKTRLIYCNSRQEVTGLVVNKKINIKRDYFKKTRAMADSLYNSGEFKINGELGNIRQLEGRFAFINQIDKFNNIHEKIHKKNIRIEEEKKPKDWFRYLNAREKEYQKFLFYKYFYANQKPMIMTEGKTDSIYVRAALKNLYKDYPELIKKKDDKFQFKIKFFKRTRRMRYFFGIVFDGANILMNIYSFYIGKAPHFPKYYEYFKSRNEIIDQAPAFILYDNERIKKNSPLNTLKNKLDTEKKEIIEHSRHIKGNLYLLTNPLVKDLPECEIEDLFDDEVLEIKFNNKSFCRKNNFDNSKYYGKKIFSEHVMNNYETINFDRFRPLLDEICRIIKEHQFQ